MYEGVNLLTVDPNLAMPGLWDLIVKTRGNPANLFESWGKEAVFEKNVPAIAAALKLDRTGVPPEPILDLIEATGIMERIAFRLVRTDDVEVAKFGAADVVVPVGTINWSVRRAQELLRQVQAGLKVKRVFALASDRVCDSSTEVGHPYIQKWREHEAAKAAQSEPGVFHAPDETQLPRESDLLAFIIQSETGIKVEDQNVIIGPALDGNIAALAEAHPELAEANIYVPRNANASVDLQVRRGIKKAFPDFDNKTGKFAFSRDDFPLARTQEQAADPARFQRPFTALSGIVRELNELHLLEA